MKLKIFRSRDLIRLEKDVNDWLSKSKVKIVTMSYCGSDTGLKETISVLYTESRTVKVKEPNDG